MYAPCAALYAGGRGGWTLFVGGVGGAGGDALCAILYAGGVRGAGGDVLFATLYAGGVGVAGGDTLVLLYMLEAVEGVLCSLEVL